MRLLQTLLAMLSPAPVSPKLQRKAARLEKRRIATSLGLNQVSGYTESKGGHRTKGKK